MMRIQLMSKVDIYNSWQELPPNTVGMVKTLGHITSGGQSSQRTLLSKRVEN